MQLDTWYRWMAMVLVVGVVLFLFLIVTLAIHFCPTCCDVDPTAHRKRMQELEEQEEEAAAAEEQQQKSSASTLKVQSTPTIEIQDDKNTSSRKGSTRRMESTSSTGTLQPPRLSSIRSGGPMPRVSSSASMHGRGGQSPAPSPAMRRNNSRMSMRRGPSAGL